MNSARTLSVFGGGIGDFILACPAFAELAKLGPFDLLGDVDRLALAVEGGIAERAFSLDRAEFHTAYSQPSPKLRRFLANYGRCIGWLGHDEKLENSLRECGPALVESHAGKPPLEWTRHASEYYAERLGVPISESFRLNIPPAPEGWDVVIQPGSGSVSKNWPIEEFNDLAQSLVARGLRVAWCLGPAEEERRFLEAISPGVRVLAASSLVELARVLAASRAYLGNDSGITHLAAAVGCPTVAVFGPTPPTVWGPRGDHVCCISGDPWPDAASVESAFLDFAVQKTPRPRRPSR